MKHLIIAAAALSLATAASASSVTTTTTTGSTAGTVVIEPEVRTKIERYVTTAKPKAVTAPSGFTVSRGAVLPETVEIHTFPSDVGVTQYRYTVVGDQTVLVDNNRRIIEVLR